MTGRLTHGAFARAVISRAGVNVAKLVSGKAAAGVAGLLSMLVAVRVLGPHDYGVLILVHTFALTVGGVLAIPGGHAVVRYGALAEAAEDEERLMRLLRLTALVELGGALLAMSIATAVAPILGPRIGWSQTALDFAAPYSLAVLGAAQTSASGFLRLRGRFDLLAAQLVVTPLVRLVGACGVALTGGTLRDFLWVWLIASLAQWASMWAICLYVLARSARPTRLGGSMRGVTRDNPGVWRFLLGVKADSALSDLAPRLTSLAIGSMLGASAAGLYAVAQRPAKVIAQPAKLFAQTAFPEFAKIAAGGGRQAAILSVIVRVSAMLLAFGFLMVTVFGFAAHPLARLLGGKAFEQAGDLVMIIGLARAVELVAPPAGAALVALGRPSRVVIAKLVGYAATLPLLPLFLSEFQLSGAGAYALLQAGIISALIGAFLWSQSRDPTSSALAPEAASAATARS